MTTKPIFKSREEALKRLQQWMIDTVDLDNCGDREAAAAFNMLVVGTFDIPDTECIE